jgi:phosphopantothenoylcysteine decarboxylase / phosphopantothenate---cysteine ligase
MKIVLGVSGSIASYKSFDLARLLVRSGHEVRVVLTHGALEFIRPETFRYIGVQEVYLPQDDFKPEYLKPGATVLHIELAKWADKLIFAPLSANTLSRLALGLNNDLLGSLYLAIGTKPVLLFPAMNTNMWSQPRIQDHVRSLQKLPHMHVINPVSGLLACGDIGAGKFPEVEAVVDLVETINPTKNRKEKIITTAGATAAPLDPVRYLTNPSSGLMGIEITKAFLANGYDVLVLAGHQCDQRIENLKGHPNFSLIFAPTTALMKEAAVKHFPEAAAYISTGAIADIEFEAVTVKMKKETMGSTLAFHQAADILKEILTLKKESQKIVSFAAETEPTREVFMEKMGRKPVDLMVGNRVANGLIGENSVMGFQKPMGEYYFVRGQEINGPHKLSKQEVGIKLVAWYEGQTPW